MVITPYGLSGRYIGIREIAGDTDHPLIQWWLSLCSYPLDVDDEVPWCSAFCQHAPWELRLPRSKSAAARSWLEVGTPIEPAEATQGFDLVILSRGPLPQPDASIIQAPGHVGWFSSWGQDSVYLLSGNVQNGVTVSAFPDTRILGIRRLA